MNFSGARSVAKRLAGRRRPGKPSSALGRGRARKASPKRQTTAAAKRKTAARAAATRSRAKRPAPKPSRLAAAAAIVRGAAEGAVVAVAGLLPWPKDEDDPIILLETDHERFRDLLAQGEKTTPRAVKGRTELLNTLTATLNVHELIEERVLYPALEPHAEARAIVLEGYEEHHVADVLIKELHALARGDERWGAKFKVLKESIEHHLEEEEKRMFRTARAVLGRNELRDLGARMKALKAEVEG
jgi:Hemerythrin HHE cation binding domain